MRFLQSLDNLEDQEHLYHDNVLAERFRYRRSEISSNARNAKLLRLILNIDFVSAKVFVINKDDISQESFRWFWISGSYFGSYVIYAYRDRWRINRFDDTEGPLFVQFKRITSFGRTMNSSTLQGIFGWIYEYSFSWIVAKAIDRWLR